MIKIILVFLMILSGVYAAEFEVSKDNIKIIPMKDNDVLTLSKDGILGKEIIILRVAEEIVLTKINPGDNILTLKIGDDIDIDIDEDGTSDIKITVNSINDLEADVTVEKLDRVGINDLEEIREELEEPVVEKTESNFFTGFTIALIIFIVLLMIIYALKRKRSYY